MIFFQEGKKFKKQIERINRLINKIKTDINDESIEYKSFVIFYWKEEEAKQLVEEIRNKTRIRTDYVVIIEEGHVNDEESWKEYDIRLLVLEV